MNNDPPATLDAADLRSRGIDSISAADDQDLIESVELLVSLGYQLEELVGGDFAELASAALIRPDAEPLAELGAPGSGDANVSAFPERFRLAVGMAETGIQAGVTPDERRTLDFFTQLAEFADEDDVLAIARVMGTSASRLARAVTGMLRLQLEVPLTTAGGRLADVLRGYIELVESAMPAFLDANSTILKAHLAQLARADEEWSVDSSRRTTLEPKVIGFADLVGFTAFTQRADAAEFVAAIGAFEEQVQAVIVDNGGTLVKMIGDEVMFVANTPGAALAIAVALSDVGRTLGTVEGMRVGLASGRVITSGGDYFGTTVNVASRIVDLAYTHAIVVTADVAAELSGNVVTEPLGPHHLRGITDDVELFRLRP